jgi:superfamily I DNA/RNA helicase
MEGEQLEVEIIYGPPGTGKTTELQNILAKEIETTPLDKIAYVSYTKEGAEQGKNRAAEQLGTSIADLPYFRTLHSMAYRSLNLRRSDVIKREDYKNFSETVGMRFTGYYTEDFNHNDDRYLFFDILHRNNPSVSGRYLRGLDSDTLRFVRANYKSYKNHYGIVDYTDMVEQFNQQNKAVPVKIAFVDEAQDLTTLQWRMVWTAFKECDKIYIAGDDDQAIYEWSGADVNYFLRLEGKPRILRKSYRLPRRILSYAKNISAQISTRVEKIYEGTREAGEIYRILDIGELDLDNGQSWMFLSRNRYFLNDIMKELRSRGYVYKYRRKLSIEAHKVTAITSYEKVRRDRAQEIHELSRYARHTQNYRYERPWFEVFEWDDEEITYYRTVIGNKRSIKETNLYVDTIHSVKGAEADNVVILPDITRQVYSNYEEHPDSEHRVFYVGVTRARHRLYIMDPRSKYEYPLIDIWREYEV